MPTASQHHRALCKRWRLTHTNPLAAAGVNHPAYRHLSSAAAQHHGNPQVIRLGCFHDNLKSQNMPMQPQQKFGHLKFLYNRSERVGGKVIQNLDCVILHFSMII